MTARPTGACAHSGFLALPVGARFRAALARRARGRSSRRRVRGRAGSSMGGRPSGPRMWAGGSGRSHVRSGTVGGPHGGGGAQWRHPRAGTGRGGYGKLLMGTAAGIRAPTTSLTTATAIGQALLRRLLPSLLSPLRSTGAGPTTPAAGRITRRGRTTPAWPPYAAGYYADGYDERAHRSSRDAYPPNDYADDAAPAPYSYDDRSRDPAPAPRGGRGPAIVLPGESGQLRLEVRPEDTSVYVDDEFRGAAADARQLDSVPRATHDRAGPSGLRASNAIRSTS